MKKPITLFALIIVFSIFSTLIISQTKPRTEIPEKYKWNLNDIYSSTADWEKSADAVKNGINNTAGYKGRLSESAVVLKEALQNYFNTLKEFYKLTTYANRLSDENTAVSENQELKQTANNIGTEFFEKTAFFRPEILKINTEKINQFLNEEKGLAEYKMYIEDIQRMREHTLSESEEEIIASFGLVTNTPAEVFNIFTNNELPLAKVTLSTGETVELTNSSFGKYRPSEVREDRQKVFEEFFNNYGRFENTLGLNLAGKVKTDYVYAKIRGYKTALEASVDGPNVPVSVYENLITQVNKSLPTLHRFLKMKQKMLGVDTLHYYDLYTPMVKKIDMDFTVEEGQNVILEALRPLGNEYVNTLEKAYNDRWIDYLPSVGKRSGAYSTGGAYDVHPYILMNWNDDFESVSTLAHELGHTMHSYYSNKTQPFANSDYSTFVAEIASTFNENLLNNYMVENAKTNEEKLYILGSYLELLRTTIFRQTMFAEFEWEIHKLAENSQPISGETLSNIYLGLVRKYYGEAEGICIVDPYIAYEWSYILHFLNYTYYVYQYATSLIYATALAEKVVAEGQPAVDKYYTILKGGSSEYPVELIKKAGVDPLSSEAFELTMNRMNRIMDQMEEIIGKM